MSRHGSYRISPADMERRRKLYLTRIKENTVGFINRFQKMYDEMLSEGLDRYTPNELNEIRVLLLQTRNAMDQDVEKAQNISRNIGQKISQIRSLAITVKKKIEFEEKEKRTKLLALKTNLESEIEKFLNDLYNSIDDPIIKDFAFEGYLNLKKDLSATNQKVSDLESIKKNINSQMNIVVENAAKSANEWRNNTKNKNKVESNKELVEIFSEQIRSAQKENPEEIRAVLEDIKSIDIENSCDRIAEEMEKSIEKTNEAVLDERIRKETVIGIMKSLKSAGFSVHKPTKTKDGYVKVRAKKPSGNKAFCRINLEGNFEYKFDSYKGMSCLKDIGSFETDLEDVYGFKISEKRVLWENPDRIKKGSRENPTGGKSRGSH